MEDLIEEVVRPAPPAPPLVTMLAAAVVPKLANAAIRALVTLLPPDKFGMAHLKRARKGIDESGAPMLEVRAYMRAGHCPLAMNMRACRCGRATHDVCGACSVSK